MGHNVPQLHVCCVKTQNYLSVKHEAERYKTNFKFKNNLVIACNCCYK